MNRLTKRQFRERLGFKTDASIANYFEISAGAVSQWAEDEFIPEIRQLQAERRHPDLFAEAGPEPMEQVA